MTGGDARRELDDLVARLQVVAEDLRDEGAGPERLKDLSDEALELSRRITELLPQVIREAG